MSKTITPCKSACQFRVTPTKNVFRQWCEHATNYGESCTGPDDDGLPGHCPEADSLTVLAQRNALLKTLKEFHAAALVFAGSEPDMPTHEDNAREFDRLDAEVAALVKECEAE